jgi:protein SCO1/2
MTRLSTPLFLAALVLSLTLALSACGPKTGAAADNQSQNSGVPDVGGPFQLVNQDNRPVDQHVLDGKWTAVFFGYTFCPDVCPTTLTTLGRAQTLLGPKAKTLQVVFISVDPGRDTPAQLKAYLSSPAFPKGAIGLTGTPVQVDQAAKAYKVFYMKEGSGQSYTVDHTAAIYLMNPQGKFDRVLAESLTPNETATQISQAMDEGPKAGA